MSVYESPASRWGVEPDAEADEQLAADLIAITEAEREALRNGALFIGASSHLPAVQRLAGEVLYVANKPAVEARNAT